MEYLNASLDLPTTLSSFAFLLVLESTDNQSTSQRQTRRRSTSWSPPQFLPSNPPEQDVALRFEMSPFFWESYPFSTLYERLLDFVPHLVVVLTEASTHHVRTSSSLRIRLICFQFCSSSFPRWGFLCSSQFTAQIRYTIQSVVFAYHSLLRRTQVVCGVGVQEAKKESDKVAFICVRGAILAIREDKQGAKATLLSTSRRREVEERHLPLTRRKPRVKGPDEEEQ